MIFITLDPDPAAEATHQDWSGVLGFYDGILVLTAVGRFQSCLFMEIY